MSEIKVEAYQFFSRASLPIGKQWSIRASSAQRPELPLSLHFEHVQKPFEILLAQLLPTSPSVGAHQFLGSEFDSQFSRRWPTCLATRGTVQLPTDRSDLANDIRRDTLYFLRRLLWELPDGIPSPEIPSDQRATVLGYRREFVHSQAFDILGNRRPSNITAFAESEIGEPIGPGVATIMNAWAPDAVNELVWSPVLPFPTRSTIDNDKPAIKAALAVQKRHYNSYSELGDARRHLEHGEIKAAVRSAASAVEACLLHLRQVAGVGEPPTHLPFDLKIEHTLSSVGRPSYCGIEPIYSKRLLYLYRARSSMHEGDCVYKDDSGIQIQVSNKQQVREFFISAQAFILWVDSMV